MILLIIIAAAAAADGNVPLTGQPVDSNKFETVRTYINAWLTKLSPGMALISASHLKDSIVDAWDKKRNEFQIVSVRTPDDYKNAGHIAHAINIYWAEIAADESLVQLDSNKNIILYCYFGHGSMIASTILSLLGYRCQSLNFGMMGWNLDAMVKAPWDKEADYEVETAPNEPEESFLAPVIAGNETDARSIIKKMARKYLGGEGSPVILSSDVKAIVDDWNKKRTEYQIVDVRSRADYTKGHIPHSINILWTAVAEKNNLEKLDPDKTSILYSENGQTGQLATTVLSLLGYRAVDMKFGMMDWNKSCVDTSAQWNAAMAYPVEF